MILELELLTIHLFLRAQIVRMVKLVVECLNPLHIQARSKPDFLPNLNILVPGLNFETRVA